MKSLKELEGELISALIPMINSKIVQEVRLHKVEDAGLWIESQEFTNDWLGAVGVMSAPKTIVHFIPWQQLLFVWKSVDTPAFS